MSTQGRHDCEDETGADAHRLGASLPGCLAGLVSAEVWAESNRRVEEKLRERATREASKRLYIEALAAHLEEEVSDANVGSLEDSTEELPRRAA
jgi:hypothetical protein